MSFGRIILWAIVAFFCFLPLNWIRLWVEDDIPKDATLTQFIIGTIVCLGIASGLAYFLVIKAKSIKMVKEKEDLAMKELLEAPLEEIRPSTALMKAGEKAYGAIEATLQEVKTVGYSAATKGMSVRVAKGLTLRTGGMRGKAVKGMVGVSKGELVITNQRVIFVGDHKSFAIKLDDLLNTTNFIDGFGFNDQKTNYTLITNDEKARVHFQIAMAKVLESR